MILMIIRKIIFIFYNYSKYFIYKYIYNKNER